VVAEYEKTHLDENRGIPPSRLYAIMRASLDDARIGSPDVPAITPKEFLENILVFYPSKAQIAMSADFLRNALPPSCKARGKDKWRVPIRRPCSAEIAGEL
jgi:hypothetical protein